MTPGTDAADGARHGAPAAGSRAGSAYLVAPDDGPGPGVLVLHSWWGLTRGVKATVEALADEGFTALAPDLLPGPLPADVTHAARRLADADTDASAALVISSIDALRAHSADPAAPVSLLGYSMGGSWAMWIATRAPDSVVAVVDYYGLQDIDFSALRAPVLCHFADSDPLVSEDEIVEMQSHLLLLEKSVEVHHHPDTRHFFAEEDVPALGADGATSQRTDAEAAAAAAAWRRTVEFLRTHVR